MSEEVNKIFEEMQAEIEKTGADIYAKPLNTYTFEPKNTFKGNSFKLSNNQPRIDENYGDSLGLIPADKGIVPENVFAFNFYDDEYVDGLSDKEELAGKIICITDPNAENAENEWWVQLGSTIIYAKNGGTWYAPCREVKDVARLVIEEGFNQGGGVQKGDSWDTLPDDYSTLDFEVVKSKTSYPTIQQSLELKKEALVKVLEDKDAKIQEQADKINKVKSNSIASCLTGIK